MTQRTWKTAESSAPPLTAVQVDAFAESGYLVLPGLLPEDLVSRLLPEVDRWVDEGLRARSIASSVDPRTHGLPPLLEIEMAAHGELVGHPPLMALLSQLMGPRFAFHHMHSDRHGIGLPGKPWHHDYEQRPQRDRTYSMIHLLHYVTGMTQETAALVVLPGSHQEVAEKTDRAHLGTDPLPGEVVIDDLPRGSTVVAHSALFHARRAKPGERGGPRYFIDASYCEVGPTWPTVKPYWRHVLARGRELALDRGEWPDLFAEHHFDEYAGSA